MESLSKQIVFDPETAIQTNITKYGPQYNQIIRITGANGKVIDVTFAWIKNEDGLSLIHIQMCIRDRLSRVYKQVAKYV